MWLTRRRDLGRPAARLERAWSAVAWGAPLSLAVAVLRTPAGCAATFWVVLLAAVASGQTPPALRRSPVVMAGIYRLPLAAVLLVVGIGHLNRCRRDATALCVDLGVIALATGFGAVPRGTVRRAWIPSG